MFAKEIKYTDYNGEERTETMYFNMSKPELFEMTCSESGGYDKFIKKIVETKDLKSLQQIFTAIILNSYGEKSADGKSFVKTEEMKNQFKHTAAYEALYMELITDEEAASEFILRILPKDIGDAIKNSKEMPKIEFDDSKDNKTIASAE